MPIISPWVLYWISVLSNLTQLLIVGIVITLSAILTLWLFHGLSYDGDIEKAKKPTKPLVIATIVLSALLVFIPTTETMYGMLVLEQITAENLNAVQKSSTELIDYLIEKIDTVLEEEK